MAKYTAKSSGIYIIINTKNGHIYIGQSQNVSKRWGEHTASLNGGYHENSHLQRAWLKYGEKAFQFRVLEFCSVDQLNRREQHCLDIYMEKGLCYNIAKDAQSPARGLKRSVKTRKKISDAMKGRVAHNKGKPMSEKQRADLVGRRFSEEHRRNISKARKGKTISEETRQKLRIVNRGERNGFFGKRHTLETNRKIGDANRKITDEQIALIQLLIWQGVIQKHIGQTFGVTQSLISLIKSKLLGR